MSPITSNARVEMAIEDARVDRRRLLAGAGVELGAHRVEDLVDLQGAEALGAAEEQVLEQVREPGLLVGLRARAGADPEPERGGSHGGHRLRDDPHARVQLGQPVLVGTAGASSVSGDRDRARRRGAGGRCRDRAAVAAALAVAVPPRRARGGRRRRCRRRRRSPRAPRPTCRRSSGSSARRRPMRPRSRSTSTTLDLDLVALVEDVLDRVDALAGRDVRDVQQAVGALGELDERAERRGLDDLAVELVADLDLLGHRRGCGRRARRPSSPLAE